MASAMRRKEREGKFGFYSLKVGNAYLASFVSIWLNVTQWDKLGFWEENTITFENFGTKSRYLRYR